MIPESRILKDYRDTGAMNALVGIHAAIDERAFLTKSGDLMMAIHLRGLDSECKDALELDQITRRFGSALRVLGEDCRLYQYLVKRSDPSIPARTYENPVVQEAIANHIAHLTKKAGNLYSLEIYFIVVYEGWRRKANAHDRLASFLKSPLATLRERLSPEKQITLMKRDLDRARDALAQKVMSFVVQLPDALHAKALDKHQTFRFLRRLLNYAPHKTDAVRLKYDRFVDFQACDSHLECHRDHLRLDDYYVKTLTLKEPPSQTFAHVLRSLQEVPCNFIVATEWKQESHQGIRKLIQSKRRHFHNKKSSMMNYAPGNVQSAPQDVLVDDSAVALIHDLGACLEEIEIKGRAFGQFSLTVVLYDLDRQALRRSVAGCVKVFATHGAQVIEERYNLLNSWLAVIPGNGAYNLRRLWLLDSNCADLSFLFAPRTGETENAHLGSEYLAVLETDHGTPYYLNLHHQDVAHSLILGSTGSGKSFLINFLLTHAQKYQPLTYIFDLGGSYENVTRLFGGRYTRVGMEHRSFSINPFALPSTPENIHFLFGFLRVLIESGAFVMSAQDERELFEQIENVYAIDPGERRLLTLANMLGRRLRAQLEKWIEGGPYAALFDNVEDTLTFAKFQTFDFEGMDKVRHVLEPFLFYVLHRANAAIYAPSHAATFKLFVCDEAWRFFRHPTIKLYITEALKTWRKKNAAMILATQSSDDLLSSEMLPVVVESCPTKMFLANPGMDKKTYSEIFHLNETEAALISRLIPKQQILVKRPELAKVVNLHVDPKDYWLYTSSPSDRERQRDAFERSGFKGGFDNLVKESKPS